MIALTSNPLIGSQPAYSRLLPCCSPQLKSETARQRADKYVRNELTRVRSLKSRNRTQQEAARRIEASLYIMMAQLDKPMKISTLSATVGLSNSSFFDRFKSATGQTPLNLFIRARMRWAGELLAETPLQIQEVAGRVGYDDQFYFSRLFKSVHGLSPRDYRAQKRAQPPDLIATYQPKIRATPNGFPPRSPASATGSANSRPVAH